MTERTRRILMTVFGVTICGFSVGMFNFSAYGMDPFMVFAHGVWYTIPEGLMGFGTAYAILNLLMLIAIFFLDKKKIGLGTVINVFFQGYVVEFSSWLFQKLIGTPSLIVRWIFLILAILIICFGSAIYYTADMGVSTYDAVPLIMCERKKKWKYQYCKMGCDLTCTAVGFLLGAAVGLGTVITAFFMGPLIAFFKKNVAVPMRYGTGNFLFMRKRC